MAASEIILILLVYLLLFGAKGVPALAQTLGKAVYQFKNASREVQSEIMKSADDIRKQASVRLDQVEADTSVRTPVTPLSKPASPPEVDNKGVADNTSQG